MRTLVADSFKAVYGKIDPYRRINSFEIYGFDILLDDDIWPWLLEVNIHPSLAPSSEMDKVIKTSLLTDSFHLIGFPLYPTAIPKAKSPWRKRSCKGKKINKESIENMLATNIEETVRWGNYRKVFPLRETIIHENFITPNPLDEILHFWVKNPFEVGFDVD